MTDHYGYEAFVNWTELEEDQWERLSPNEQALWGVISSVIESLNVTAGDAGCRIEALEREVGRLTSEVRELRAEASAGRQTEMAL